ncbi:MAG: asparaginase [Chloroflexota bacterium]
MSVPMFRSARNGVVERLERGHCVLVDTEGRIVWSAGDPDHVTFLRSSSKPIQATALLLSGAVERFALEPAHIAVSCASHKGEPRHVETVSDLLRRAGVSADALQCGTHDLSPPVFYPLARAGIHPTPLHNNCSGKHAGMLVAAQAMGAPLESYLEPDHPVQQRILRALAACAGLSEDRIARGVDGCSAPNFALPMHAIARCFAAIADPRALDPELARALTSASRAMRADPWLVRGTDGLDTALMSAFPVISKGGAEGLLCMGFPGQGLGLAIKFESGRSEGAEPVLLAILQGLGMPMSPWPRALLPFDRSAVRNHRGIEVGDTKVLLDLSSLPQL